AILEAEPQVLQVGINYGDAAKLTNTCAAETDVRRTPDAGRYLITNEIASGPAMFDTTRLNQAGGLKATDPDPLTELQRRALALGQQTATLDEILCTTT
ncbi:glycosyl transferase, partial [Mycobacterium sp. 050134]